MIDWKKVRRRRAIVSAVEWTIKNAPYLYIMYACGWSILRLVGEIFEKMGVG